MSLIVRLKCIPKLCKTISFADVDEIYTQKVVVNIWYCLDSYICTWYPLVTPDVKYKCFERLYQLIPVDFARAVVSIEEE